MLFKRIDILLLLLTTHFFQRLSWLPDTIPDNVQSLYF